MLKFGKSMRRMVRERRGAAALEFAIVSPPLLMLLMGGMEFAHELYLRAALHGAMQKASRDSTLEIGSASAQQTAIENSVRTQLAGLHGNATLGVSRRFYKTFSTALAAQAETHTESNGNGRCDNNEPYSDANANGVWDRDGGNAGQGGARDVTVLTAQLNYQRLFGISSMLGFSPNVELRATSVLANQPYGTQATYAPPVIRNCP